MRVLVADESATLREGAQSTLQAAGHEVVLAADGLNAYRLALARPPDAAFISWSLPGLDGLDVAGLWMQQPQLADLPVVMMVEGSRSHEVRLWAQLGTDGVPAWDVLTKPFAPALMAEVLGGLRS